MCNHARDLGRNYLGVYCIYCGDDLKKVEAADGQIAIRFLDESYGARYLAIVKDGQQKSVELASLTNGRLQIRFFGGGGGEAGVSAVQLLEALDGDEECLRISGESAG